MFTSRKCTPLARSLNKSTLSEIDSIAKTFLPYSLLHVEIRSVLSSAATDPCASLINRWTYLMLSAKISSAWHVGEYIYIDFYSKQLVLCMKCSYKSTQQDA